MHTVGGYTNSVQDSSLQTSWATTKEPGAHKARSMPRTKQQRNRHQAPLVVLHQTVHRHTSTLDTHCSSALLWRMLPINSAHSTTLSGQACRPRVSAATPSVLDNQIRHPNTRVHHYCNKKDRVQGGTTHAFLPPRVCSRIGCLQKCRCGVDPDWMLPNTNAFVHLHTAVPWLRLQPVSHRSNDPATAHGHAMADIPQTQADSKAKVQQ